MGLISIKLSTPAVLDIKTNGYYATYKAVLNVSIYFIFLRLVQRFFFILQILR